MADDLENFGRWRDKVETRLGKLETTVEEQARLRAAMDKDMGDMKSELRAHMKVIEAVHVTQSDHTNRLTRLETKVDEVEKRLGTVEERLGTVEGTLRKVHTGVELIHGKLDTIIDSDR